MGFNVSPTNGLTVTGGGTQTFNLGGTNGSNNCHTLTLTLELDGSAPPPNSYEVTIEPLADNSCFNGLSESERTLTIDNITPLPVATFSYPMFTGCNAAFTSVPQAGYHLWTFGDGGTSTDADPTHLYTADGTFLVTHTVTNACGTAIYPVTVTVSCNPTFEYEAQDCSNTIHFTSATSGTHQWYVYDPQGTQVGQSIAQGFNFAFNGTGTFRVTLSINRTPSALA